MYGPSTLRPLLHASSSAAERSPALSLRAPRASSTQPAVTILLWRMASCGISSDATRIEQPLNLSSHWVRAANPHSTERGALATPSPSI
jgi:hypothetical protein